jgi:hypothetical protein
MASTEFDVDSGLESAGVTFLLKTVSEPLSLRDDAT